MLGFFDTILFLPAVIICSDVILIPFITLYKILKNKHLQHFSIQSDTFYRNNDITICLSCTFVFG